MNYQRIQTTLWVITIDFEKCIETRIVVCRNKSKYTTNIIQYNKINSDR